MFSFYFTLALSEAKACNSSSYWGNCNLQISPIFVMSVLAVSLIILSITCCGKKEKVGPEEENSFDIKVPNDQSNVKSDDDEKNIKAREIYFGNLPGEGNSNDKNDNTLSRKSTVAIPKYFEIEPANHSSSLVMIPRMNSFIKK